MHYVAIEREQTELGRKQVARLSYAFSNQFPSFSGHGAQIVDYIRGALAVSEAIDAAAQAGEATG